MRGFSIFLFAATISISCFARSMGGGGGLSLSGTSSMAIALGTASPSQDDLNSMTDNINGIGGRNATKVGSGLEFAFQYMYRVSGTMYAFVFRPSYLQQNGKGSTDSVDLTGMLFFPMLRLYPLENDFIHFYMQAGVGYGKLSGQINQPGGNIQFNGSAFGALAGLGAEFCFTSSQCMFLEGNFRYLPIDRSLVSQSYSNSSGTTGLSQSTPGAELEVNGHDIGTSLSGIVGSIGYQINF